MANIFCLIFSLLTIGALGLVGTDGSGFQFAPTPPSVPQELFSPAWAPDGKAIYAQDTTNIYHIDLSGKMLGQWKISDALPNADMNSGSRIEPSGDGKSLLVEADLNEEGNIKSWDGPPPVVFLFDVGTGKARRISAPFTFAFSS